MAKDIIDTLHPEGSLSDNFYPNIKTANIPSGAVTTDKIQDSAVTGNKIADGSIYTSKIADGAVTQAKLNTSVYGKVVSLSTDQTITGQKTFTAHIKNDEIDNTNGNAMLRYKSTENKVVLGGSTIPTTIMGSGDRPNYSANGSDFSGNPLALKSDVDTETTERKAQDTALQTNIDKKANTTDLDTLKSSVNSNWSLLMANLGIGRWRGQNFYNLAWLSSPNIYDSLLPYYTDITGIFAEVNYSSGTMVVKNDFKKSVGMNYAFFKFNANVGGGTLVLSNHLSSKYYPANVEGLSIFESCGCSTIKVDEGKDFCLPNRLFYTFANCPNLTQVIDLNFKYVTEYHTTMWRNTNNIEVFKVKNYGASLSIKSWTKINTEALIQNVIDSLDTEVSGRTLTINSTQNSAMTDAQRTYLTDTLGWSISVA